MRLKEETRVFVHMRLAYFNAFYGFKVGRVFIKNHKSRWGSCSSKGNLNFNYKILRLPSFAADYIIVHELCHLHEFNHSPKFWELVSQSFPEYGKARRLLRTLEKL